MAATTVKEKFDAAVHVIQSLPKNGSFQPSYEMMLKFYAFYKQATNGPINIPRPAFYDVVGKAKWDAWNKLGEMPRETAMGNYVDELKKIIEAMPHTEMVADFMEKLGSFYEIVEDKQPIPLNGAIINGLKKNHKPLNGTVPNGNVGTNGTDGHLSDSSGAESDTEETQQAVEVNDGSYVDSEGEEFCDTSDGSPDGANVQRIQAQVHTRAEDSSDLEVTLLTSRGGSEGDGSTRRRTTSHSAAVPPRAPSSTGRGPTPVGGGDFPAGGAGGGHFPPPGGAVYRAEVNEQIAVALVRLQQDMSSVLARLNTLETLTVAQHQVNRSRHSSETAAGSWWWPFTGLQPRTVLFIFLWPFIVNWVLRLLRRRRLNQR